MLCPPPLRKFSENLSVLAETGFPQMMSALSEDVRLRDRLCRTQPLLLHLGWPDDPPPAGWGGWGGRRRVFQRSCLSRTGGHATQSFLSLSTSMSFSCLYLCLWHYLLVGQVMSPHQCLWAHKALVWGRSLRVFSKWFCPFLSLCLCFSF